MPDPSASHSAPPCRRFGVFEFDARSLELRKNGRIVKVRPQSLKLLNLLLDRPGELVSRDELQHRLWGADTFVDYDQGVNHCIKELRAALGDSAELPRYIETLSRRGYRFIAPVEHVVIGANGGTPAARAGGADVPEQRASETGSRRLRWWAAGGVLGLVIVSALLVRAIVRPASDAMPPLSEISVVPFAAEPADSALGVGLAHAISRRLGGQQTIVVRTPGEPDAVADGNVASSTAARTGVVLDGDIVRNGSNVVVFARLTRVDADAVVWSDRIQVRADELFSIEDVIAERVVTALGLQLAAAEQQRLRRRYTVNTAAYSDYLRGRAALVKYTPDATRDAVAAFESALIRDPNYALARAGLAVACADMCLRFASGADVDRWAERAEREARAALDLDPELAEAHLARAAIARKREFDWNATVAASRRALLLNPNLDQARFYIAAAYYHLGYMDESIIEMEKGRALRGGDVVEPVRIEGLVALFSGKFAPALAHLEEVSRSSSQPIGDTYLALAAYYSGGIDRGRTMLEELVKHKSIATATRSGAILAAVLASLGDTARGRAELERVLASRYRDHHVAYNLGVAHAQLGDMGEALRWLRTAADTGFPCLPWFERDPLLAGARQHPSFGELLKYVRERRDAALSNSY